MSVLFLDIDGVLNNHAYDNVAKSSTLDKPCVERLNRVLITTDCQIVISSAWRYMIHLGAITLRGFEYLLRTHGVRCVDRLLGATDLDDPESRDPRERAVQIQRFMERRRDQGCRLNERYAVVDDLDLGLSSDVFVRTNGETGLSDANVDRLIAILNGV